jgi:hypothetical protein
MSFVEIHRPVRFYSFVKNAIFTPPDMYVDMVFLFSVEY